MARGQSRVVMVLIFLVVGGLILFGLLLRGRWESGRPGLPVRHRPGSATVAGRNLYLSAHWLTVNFSGGSHRFFISLIIFPDPPALV